METKPRVRLSPLQDEHIARYMALSDDQELIDTMGWTPFSPDEKERFSAFTRVLSLPNLESEKAVVFSIINTSDEKPIGYLSIKGISQGQARAEVGIAIMERDYRGQGCGTEALRLAADYAFRELGLKSLGLTVFLSNKGAIRAYEKVGFRKTATLKDAWLLPSGEYADMSLMELSAD
jgi:RimJ/RimL family protein N-acetyltransferase